MQTSREKRIQELLDWARQNLTSTDPDLLDKLCKEAHRRWSYMTKRKHISCAKETYIRIRYHTNAN